MVEIVFCFEWLYGFRILGSINYVVIINYNFVIVYFWWNFIRFYLGIEVKEGKEEVDKVLVREIICF